MSILNFIKPEKVILIEQNNLEGRFEFRPLESGFGLTIGNALRRVLLSSLEGYAFSSLKIDGIEHEFSTIEGVVEDVTEIILNLKQVRLKKQIYDHDSESEVVTVIINNQSKLTAGDIGKFISGFEVLNPDILICNMDKSVTLKMMLTINKGRGFVPAEQNKTHHSALGAIFIDSIYTPIKNVKYSVEDFRVDQKTDFEKLTIDIKTDGSISPQEALTETAKILIHHFMLFSDERITLEVDKSSNTNAYDEEILRLRQLLKSKLVDMELSVRALNCLKAAEVETLGELVAFSKSDLMKFRNFGRKSLTELEELIVSKGLSFGMDITKYKLDTE